VLLDLLCKTLLVEHSSLLIPDIITTLSSSVTFCICVVVVNLAADSCIAAIATIP
jgi:hypothetical protein